MKSGQRSWTREELILAINLYCKLPYGRLHNRNPDIIELAQLIHRTTNSVALKLNNFASLDPSQQARGIKGAANTSKLDREIWDEFFNHWDTLPYESEKLLAQHKQVPVEVLNQIPEHELPREGKTREQVIKARVNQSFFRSAVLAAYNHSCCMTGIAQPALLVAGHIRPWGLDEKNRLNPRNGILLNALHDKAFEAGFLTITPDYLLKISPQLLKQKDAYITEFFGKYHNQPIRLPKRFLPDPAFLTYHNEERFQF